MGDGPLKWAFVEAYIKAFKGLLRGEVVEWDGSRLRMLHPEGHAPPRPVEVPVIIGALGPKGGAIAKQQGDGLIAVAGVPDFAKEFSWVTYLCFGTVLDDGEDLQSERVRNAAGPATMITYHGTYEYGGSVAGFPGGEEWLAAIEQTPTHERHLAVHHQHQVGLNSADQAAWNAGAHAMIESFSFSGTKAKIRDKVAQLADRGVTEIAYQPAGPDIRRELSTFLEAASAA
jgi:5,10-methylenetetrahydromethanopterin reductase